MSYPSTRNKEPSTTRYGEIVHIKVGPATDFKLYNVHKGVITFYSGFFDKALNGAFVESKGTAELPEEEVAVVEQFILWLYKGKLMVDEWTTPMAFQMLCRLWLFGDRREVPLLMNDCINALRDRIVREWLVPVHQLDFVYQNTTPNAGLRRFLIKVIGSINDRTALQPANSLSSITNAEILHDLLYEVWTHTNQRLNKQTLVALDLCPYHQHNGTVTCKGDE